MQYVAASQHMSSDDLTAFVVALANTIGLTLLILLLGHGLVELPRKFWHEASLVIRMKHFLFKLKEVDVDYETAKEEMVKLFGIVNKVKGKMKAEDELYYCLQEIETNIPAEQEKKSSFNILSLGGANYDGDKLYEEVSEASDVDIALLAKVNFRAKRVTQEIRRVKQQFEHTVDKCIECEKEMLEMLDQNPPSFDRPSIEGVQWLFTNKYGRRMLLMRLVGAGFALMSLFVIWCEITMFSSQNMSIFAKFVESAQPNAAGVQIAAMIPLAYVCACAFFSAFRLRLASLYVGAGRAVDLFFCCCL